MVAGGMTDAERIAQLEDVLAILIGHFEVAGFDGRSGERPGDRVPVVAQAQAILGPEAWARITRQAAAEAEVVALRSLLDTELAALRSMVEVLMAARAQKQITPPNPFVIWSRSRDSRALDAAGPSLARWLARLVLRRTRKTPEPTATEETT